MALGEAASARRLGGAERERLIALVARLRAAEGATNIDEALQAIDALTSGQQTQVRACGGAPRGLCGAHVRAYLAPGWLQPKRAQAQYHRARARRPAPSGCRHSRTHVVWARVRSRGALPPKNRAARTFSRVLRARARPACPSHAARVHARARALRAAGR
jgi:hypothetical protein